MASAHAADETMRRAESLVANDGHAASAIDALALNVAGTGMQPQSYPDHAFLGITEAQAEAFAESMEAAWRLWCAVMRAWARGIWTRPPRGQVNPVKERQAEDLTLASRPKLARKQKLLQESTRKKHDTSATPHPLGHAAGGAGRADRHAVSGYGGPRTPAAGSMKPALPRWSMTRAAF